MRHRRRVIGLREDRALGETVDQFREVRGEAGMMRRAAEIARLPVKFWRGVPVYRLTCEGPFGRGPHEIWLPERVLWSLIDLRHLLCAFHR